MSKNDILNYLDIVFAVGGYIFTRSIAKFNAIKKEWDGIKKKQVLQDQSLKRAWEEIDKLKLKVPHGGEI